MTDEEKRCMRRWLAYALLWLCLGTGVQAWFKLHAENDWIPAPLPLTERDSPRPSDFQVMPPKE